MLNLSLGKFLLVLFLRFVLHIMNTVPNGPSVKVDKVYDLEAVMWWL